MGERKENAISRIERKADSFLPFSRNPPLSIYLINIDVRHYAINPKILISFSCFSIANRVPRSAPSSLRQAAPPAAPPAAPLAPLPPSSGHSGGGIFAKVFGKASPQLPHKPSSTSNSKEKESGSLVVGVRCRSFRVFSYWNVDFDYFLFL